MHSSVSPQTKDEAVRMRDYVEVFSTVLELSLQEKSKTDFEVPVLTIHQVS